MNNKKIILLIIGSIIIASGIFLLILPFLPLQIEGTIFSGIMVILFGIIFMLGTDSMSKHLDKIFNNFISSFKSEERSHLYFCLIFLIIGIVLRLIYIIKPINYSEAVIYLDYLEGKTFHQLFFYSSPDNFILNNIFIKFLFLLSNKEIWVLRIPSLIAGISLMPTAYITARLFYNKYAAQFTLAFISISPFFIYYSSDMRGISLIMFLFLLSLIIIRYLRYNDDTIVWILLALVSSAGLLVSPLYVLPFLSVMIWFILSAIFKDVSYKIRGIVRSICTVIIATFLFTFLFYIPVMISSGIKNVIDYNFIDINSLLLSFRSFLASINSAWFSSNKNLNIVLVSLLVAGVILSLVFSRKNSKHKVPVFYAILIIFAIFIISGITFPFAEVWAFALPVLIIEASFGFSCLFTMNFKKIKKKSVAGMSTLFLIITIFIAVVLTSLNFIFDSVLSINALSTLKDSKKIVANFADKFNPNNKIILEKPSDYIIRFELSKIGKKDDYSSGNYYPEDNVIFIVNKSANQEIDEITNKYFTFEDFESTGYTKPKVLDEYESAIIYESSSLVPESETIFDLNEQSNMNLIELKDFVFSDSSGATGLLMDKNHTDTLKYIKIPVRLEENTDYVVTFDIVEIDDIDNKVFVDLYGTGYDNPQQEFSFDHEIFKDNNISGVRKVINSGSFNNELETFLRIFTYCKGEILIKNLKMNKISD